VVLPDMVPLMDGDVNELKAMTWAVLGPVPAALIVGEVHSRAHACLSWLGAVGGTSRDTGERFRQ
jgi:hypothetical protein